NLESNDSGLPLRMRIEPRCLPLLRDALNDERGVSAKALAKNSGTDANAAAAAHLIHGAAHCASLGAVNLIRLMAPGIVPLVLRNLFLLRLLLHAPQRNRVRLLLHGLLLDFFR